MAALLFALILALSVLRKSPGSATMQELSRAVLEGATAYLKQQYKVVGLFFALLFVVLAIISYGLKLLSPFVPFAFITGGFFSALAGYIGMSIATRANSRTAQGASESLNAGLRVAFSSGTVMGMTVVGLGLLDISIWWFLLRFAWDVPVVEIPPIMITFGMGASLQALFARLGGGIFTKAADVGADLVGKVEANIPEDDARNPATIADNVGDNVGDVAGMGADLYESYVGSIIATMALGAIASLNLPEVSALQMIQVPVSIATIGVLCSIIGTAVVRTKGDASQHVLLRALRNGTLLSTGLIAVLSLVLVLLTAGPSFVGLWGGDDRRPGGGQRHRLLHRVLHLRQLRAHQGAGGRGTDRPGHPDHPGPRPGDAFHPDPGGHGGGGHAAGVLPLRRRPVRGHRPVRHRAGRRGNAQHARHHAGHRRLRTGGRQRRRHRRDGGDGPAGARAHRRPRLARQHHRRHRQGVRHRLRGTHRPGPAGRVPQQDRRGAGHRGGLTVFRKVLRRHHHHHA